MRNLLTIAPALFLAACGAGPDPFREPPVLKVTSPERSLVKDGAGEITVTGTVGPNELGVPVEKVLVNNVQANLNGDGTWQAKVQLPEGASLIETVARDAEGGIAYDTRAVHAGEIRTAGSQIENAITASISARAFEKISAAAGPMVEGLNLGEMLAPLQPMQHAGDEGGEDCLFERVFINDVKFGNFDVQLVPVQGGISVRVQIDDLDVPGYARYAVACVDGQTNLRVSATRVIVEGTLLVTPNGMQGFTTDLVDQTVNVQGFNLQASGIPGTILDMIDMDSAIQSIVAKGAERAMEPAINSALGGLAGPKSFDVLGKTISMEVDPTDISFASDGALVAMNMSMRISGAENAKYIYTDNGLPSMDAGEGFQLGLADDLANEMMSNAKELGLLNLTMPASGGTFDSTTIAMTLPPMISADPADGSMSVVLGDMIATYTSNGTPVAKAAINARIGLKIEEAGSGRAVALKLGTPTIKFTVLDDIENISRLTDADLAKASEVCLQAQIEHIAALLVNIPLPSVAGLKMRNLSAGSDNGYVMVKGTLE
jgi:hypothetical protein